MADSTTIAFYSFGIIFVILLGLGLLYLLFSNFSVVLNLTKSVFTYPIDIIMELFRNNEPIINQANCGLFQTDNSIIPRIPSLYVAHLAFFFAFLFTNAYAVYKLAVLPNSNQNLVENRKSRALMTMIVLAIIYFGLVIIRYNMTGCESLLGVIFTTTTFGALGYLTYYFADYCGARSTDILGIATGIYDTNQTAPVMCRSS